MKELRASTKRIRRIKDRLKVKPSRRLLYLLYCETAEHVLLLATTPSTRGEKQRRPTVNNFIRG